MSAPKSVSLSIDGRPVVVPEGTLLIEAARGRGIVIPHFCYHRRLEPVAACRLCLVEIEGVRGLQAACATPVREGMVVRTSTDPALASHREVLDFVLENHPLDCGKCEASGRCQLQDFTYAHGPRRVSHYAPPGISGFHYQEVPWSPVLKFDPYKCVECTRCVRVCDEVQDCRALTTEARGHHLLVTTFANGPLHCDFCGSCASVCPTGAIEQQTGKFEKKDWEMERRRVICAHCGHGCTLLARVNRGRVVRVEDDPEAGINRANLCAKGRFGFDILEAKERVKKPLVRRGQELVETSWDEAFSAAAGLVGNAKSVAGLASGHLSVEDLLAFRFLLDARPAERFSESRDGDAIARFRATAGRMPALAFDDLASFPSIVLVDLPLDALDDVARVEVARAVRKGSVLTALGRSAPRLARRVAKALPLEASALGSVTERSAVLLDAERVPEAILEESIRRAKTDDWRILFIASQPNSRSLGPLGFRAPARGVAGLAADLLFAAGPLHLAQRPAGVGRLVVSAHALSPLARQADVVFPAVISYEKPGTYVNSEGRPQFSPAAAFPPGEAWPDGAIWAELARRLGRETPRRPADLLEAARKAAPELWDPAAGATEPAAGVLPATMIPEPRPFEGLMLGSSAWLECLRKHLDASREFAPWPS